MIASVILLGILYFCFSTAIREHKIVKNAQGDYFYLSYSHAEYLRPIPDSYTVEELGFDAANVVTVDDSFLEKFKRLPALQTLKLANGSPDETMRVKIAKIMILAHPSYVIESFPFKGKLNPSIELIDGNILMSYRDHMYDSPIRFAWLEKTNLTYLPISFSYFGIDNFITPDITTYDFNVLQEDPRLMYMKASKQLLVQYHAKEELMSYVRTVLCTVTPEPTGDAKKPNQEGGFLGSGTLVTQYDPTDGQYKTVMSTTNTADFSNSVVFDRFNYTKYANPKNWVMFTDPTTHKVLFMENINPMVVLETGPARHHNASIHAVVNSTTKVPLPWLDEYGPLIRGGTPGIRVPSSNVTGGWVNLAFFHTVAGFQIPYLWTYFMGAFTFCPSYPYSIQSMSSRPIVPWSGLYDGAWVHAPVLDYVVFPTGIVLLEDQETLLVSFGSQDKDGYVLKMSLTGLLASMTEVQDCGESGGGGSAGRQQKQKQKHVRSRRRRERLRKRQ